jgi:hypothetical protein
LKRKGCEIQSCGAQPPNDSNIYQCAEPVAVDGFSIIATHAESPPPDASHFELQGLDERTSRWVTAGSCRFRYLKRRARFLPAPCARPAPLQADFRPPWPLKIAVAVDAVLGVALLLASLAGPALARALLAAALLLAACLHAAAAAGFIAIAAGREAILFALYTLPALALALSLRAAERLLPAALALAGALGVLARAASDCGGFADCALLREDPPLAHAALACAGAALLARRRLARRAAARTARADREAYDAAWRPVAVAERAELDRLADDAAAIAAACPPGAARHLRLAGQPSLVLHLPASASTAGAEGAEGAAERRPVTSLSQLYAQARTAKPTGYRSCL